MSNAARAGRRRRFLHEGSSDSSNRSASKSESNDSATDALATGNRYAQRRGSASFAIAKRLLPQAWGSVSLAMLGIFSVIAMLAAAGNYVPQLLAADSFVASELFQLGSTATLSAWFASSLWLAIAGVALVLFGVRRQRMDDLRCQYRWWLVAAFTAFAMSFNASVGGHQYFADSLAEWTGWSPLPGNAFWWFLPAALVAGGITVRMIVDLAESRLALVASILAVLTISIGWSVEAGLVPNSLANGSTKFANTLIASPLLGPTTSLVGISLIFFAMILYSRHIVLEEEGVIAKPAVKPKSKKTPVIKTSAEKSVESDKSNLHVKAKVSQGATRSKNEAKTSEKRKVTEQANESSKPTQTRAERRAEEKRQRREEANAAKSEPTIWVSGDDTDYRDEYEEDGSPRKLSKSERKRLRKQKARRAA